MRRICPVCANRQDGLIDAECLICQGRGFLILGSGALALYPPGAVAEAIVLALEAVARKTDLTRNLSQNRRGPILEVLGTLYDAGILAPSETPAPPRPVSKRPRKRDLTGQFVSEQTPTDLAQTYVQEPLVPLDSALTHAPCHTYREDDRPNARGLPVLSAGGHPSHLARLVDPAEPGASTRADHMRRQAQHRAATVLVQAAPEAARRRHSHQKAA
jgi:hypothetical protein